MFSPPYRAAVIGRTGRGTMATAWTSALLGNPKLQPVAVADEDAEGRAAAAKRLGVEHAYADYRAMLEKEKPQFVAVAPRWLDGHKDMILACVEQGVVGILCEKPLAPDLASCDAIVTACERSHVKLAMAFQTRYSPRYEAVKKLIADGAIGELLELRGPGQGRSARRGRGPHGAGRARPGSLSRPAGRAGVVLRPRDRPGTARRPRPGPRRAPRASARSPATASTRCSASSPRRWSPISPARGPRSRASGSA